MLHLYDALAQKERRLISERTKAALAARKAGRQAPENRPIRQRRRPGRPSLTEDAEAFAANVLPLVESLRANGVTDLGGWLRR